MKKVHYKYSSIFAPRNYLLLEIKRNDREIYRKNGKCIKRL